MANVKQNKIFSRSIIIGGTVLGGMGIFAAVNHAAIPGTAASTASQSTPAAGLNPSFSTTDSFLTQSSVQPGFSSSSQPAPARSSRVRTRGS